MAEKAASKHLGARQRNAKKDVSDNVAGSEIWLRANRKQAAPGRKAKGGEIGPSAELEKIVVSTEKGNAVIVCEEDWDGLIEALSAMAAPALANVIRSGIAKC